MTKRTSTAAVALAVSALAGALLTGPSAEATSYLCPADADGVGVGGSYDTCGDVSRLGGDIVLSYADRGIRGQREVAASISTTAMPNPATGLAWSGTETEIRVFWDTDRSLPGREYRTDISAPDHVLTATTTSRDGETTCTTSTSTDLGEGRVGFIPANSGVTVLLPYDCLPGLKGSDAVPAEAPQFRIEMSYQRRPEAVTEVDQAPNAGWRPLPSARPRVMS
jgi:hypothetical protein